MRSMRAPQGFTLIELATVMAILAILAAISLPLAQHEKQRARERELRAALLEIREAIDRYKRASDEGRILRDADASGYPPSLNALVAGVPDATRPDGRRLYFLRRIPRDPLHPDTEADARTTWGLRSYVSPPDAPQPGADVFDVYSRAEGTGLNGIPYRQW